MKDVVMSDNLIDLNAKLIGWRGCKGAEITGFLNPKFIRDNLEHFVVICDGHVVCDCSAKDTLIISSWHYALSSFGIEFIDFSIANCVLVLSFVTIPD